MSVFTPENHFSEQFPTRLFVLIVGDVVVARFMRSSGFVFIYFLLIHFYFLDFINFGVRGRMLVSIPATCGLRQDPPLDELITGPYVSVWAYSTLLKGTTAVL